MSLLRCSVFATNDGALKAKSIHKCPCVFGLRGRTLQDVQGGIFRLVNLAVSRDAVDALESLLSEARAGRVIGIAYVAMHKTYDYSVNIAGETRRSPTLTRGMLHLLDDELSALIRDM